MKHNYLSIIISLLVCVILCSCNSNTNKSGECFSTVDGSYEVITAKDRLNNDSLGIETDIDTIMIENHNDAEKISKLIINKYQKDGYFKNYTLQKIAHYTDTQVWVATFSEDADHPTAECNIVINENNCEIVGVWVNE